MQIRQTQQQVDSLKNQIGNVKRADSFSVTNQNDSVLQTRYDERIKALEEELDRLSLRFTDLHPDVVESRALLESLEKSRQKEIDAFLNADESNNTQP